VVPEGPEHKAMRHGAKKKGAEARPFFEKAGRVQDE
jgi:hypothetical protein